MNQGKRKLARPLDTKRPLHLVLRSTRARGELSFLSKRHNARIEHVVRKYAKRFQVKVYDLANAGNHLHLIVKTKSREQFKSFLRTISALIARTVTGAKKGSAKGRFWDALAYTRVVEWGRAFVALKSYLSRNRLEAIGFLRHDDRALGIASALKIGSARRRP